MHDDDMMRGPSRRRVLAGAGGGAAMLWAGLSFAQGAAKFKFMTPFGYSLAFAPVLYAKAGGYFAKEGLDAEIVGGKGAALAAQMTIAGQMDAARTGAGNYMVARINNAAPLISIATIAQVSPFFVGLFGREQIGHEEEGRLHDGADQAGQADLGREFVCIDDMHT